MSIILFEKDWDLYPTARPQVDTPNHTWLRQAKVYRAMGVKNHSFLLALINQDLRGVDPFDPNLTKEQIAMIAVEVKLNPWYYFREIARVPAIAGMDRPHIRANRANICLYWLFFNHVFVILIQPRQTGKSINVDSLTVYLLMVACQNTKINLMTKDNRLRRENIGRVKDIIEALPYFLNLTTRNDANNGEEVTVLANGNHLKTHLPQANQQRALNAGRGLTSAIFLIDEGPFQVNIKTSLPAALASMGAAVEAAKKNGSPHGVIMTTTAGKLDDPSGAFIYEFLEEAATWGEHLFDCKDQEELHRTIRAASRDGETLSINATFSHRQMGYDDDWLRGRIKDAKAKGDDAARDFLNRWTSGREGSPFSPQIVERITQSQVEIAHREIHPKYRFTINWYADQRFLQEYMQENKVIVGMDTSEATGKDFIGLVFLCARTGGVLGTCVINNILTYVMIEWLADLLEKYPNLILNPERKSTAVTIIDGLLQILPSRGIDPFKRIFNWVVQEPTQNEDLYRDIQRPLSARDQSVYERSKRFFGFGTTGRGEQSRDRLYGQTLTAATERFSERIHDAGLISQLMSLEIKNNRIDHASGKHDDLVVSWLLAFWTLIYGKNLTYYGINPMDVLSVPVVREVITKDRERYLAEQKQYRERAHEVAELLTNSRDEYLSIKYETELAYLNRQIILEENEAFSIEELLNRARQRRKTEAIARHQNQNWDQRNRMVA